MALDDEIATVKRMLVALITSCDEKFESAIGQMCAYGNRTEELNARMDDIEEIQQAALPD